VDVVGRAKLKIVLFEPEGIEMEFVDRVQKVFRDVVGQLGCLVPLDYSASETLIVKSQPFGEQE
jgi:hypothetical protein